MNREKRVRLSEKVIKIEETLRRIVNPRGVRGELCVVASGEGRWKMEND